MTRALLILVVACGGKTELPAKPDVAGMGPEQKCLATAPRATPCSDELLVGEVAGLGMPDLGGKLAEDLDGTSTSKGDALTMHHVRCVGDKAYADNLVRCWDSPDCKALAACVYKTGGSPR